MSHLDWSNYFHHTTALTFRYAGTHFLGSDESKEIEEMTALFYQGIARLIRVLIPFTNFRKKWVTILTDGDFLDITNFWKKLVVIKRVGWEYVVINIISSYNFEFTWVSLLIAGMNRYSIATQILALQLGNAASNADTCLSLIATGFSTRIVMSYWLQRSNWGVCQ